MTSRRPCCANILIYPWPPQHPLFLWPFLPCAHSARHSRHTRRHAGPSAGCARPSTHATISAGRVSIVATPLRLGRQQSSDRRALVFFSLCAHDAIANRNAFFPPFDLFLFFFARKTDSLFSFRTQNSVSFFFYTFESVVRVICLLPVVAIILLVSSFFPMPLYLRVACFLRVCLPQRTCRYLKTASTGWPWNAVCL